MLLCSEEIANKVWENSTANSNGKKFVVLWFALASWTLSWLVTIQSTFLKFFGCSRFSEFDSNIDRLCGLMLWTVARRLVFFDPRTKGLDGEWNFCRGEGDRHCFILASKVDICKKDQKHVRAKLVNYCPNQDDHQQWTLKHRNKQNGSNSTDHKSHTMTFWTRS